MDTLREWWTALTNGEEARPRAADYALMLVVILIVGLGALALFGNQVSGILSTVSPPV